VTEGPPKRVPRDSRTRHDWALRSLTGVRVGPNGLRHIEESLQAVAGIDLPLGQKFEILSIVDDYVVGHCLRINEARRQPQFDRKTARALSEA
jgi:hypothetical protein